MRLLFQIKSLIFCIPSHLHVHFIWANLRKTNELSGWLLTGFIFSHNRSAISPSDLDLFITETILSSSCSPLFQFWRFVFFSQDNLVMEHVNHVTRVTLERTVIFPWLLFSSRPLLVLCFLPFVCTCWHNISSLSKLSSPFFLFLCLSMCYSDADSDFLVCIPLN